jgi:hypothetical protein
MIHLRKVETEICMKANSSKKKVKTELFQTDSVLELNTKNLGNSPSFLTITHKTLSTKWFRSSRILKLDLTAEFCFWIEQRLNGTQLLGLGLTKTPEVPNIIMVGNSLRFLMVHHMAPISWQFKSYDYQKLDRSTKIEIWADYSSRHKNGVWRNFAITSIETLNTKNATKKLSFPPATHTAHSDLRSDSYRVLKSE